MNEATDLITPRIPTVYFIDDSATMREVIKIAFRKENIHVITCSDAASALSQFGDVAPDAVITDVIMPDKDGYEVCQFIKQHDRLGKTPVVLMSGVVNRSVAEKAMAVKADELIRKPFQPHDLILRIKNLLQPKPVMAAADPVPQSPSRALTNLFSPAPAPLLVVPAPARSDVRQEAPSQSIAVAVKTMPAPMPAPPSATLSTEAQKLRNEVQRLQLLVKKLQTELEAERQYSAALEAHAKASQESD